MSGADSEGSESSAQQVADAKNVGRGALFLTFTKMWFLASSYVIVAILSRILGEGEVGVQRYGQYSVVTGFAAIINAFIVFGTQQAVSRFVGRAPEMADGVRRAAYRLQAFVGGGVFAIIFVGAPWFAETVYEDPALATPIRYAGLISLFYAFYAIFMGYLNGTRQFGRQALVDFSYATVKCILILGFAALFMDSVGVLSAPILGFAAASFFALLLGWWLSGPAKGEGSLTVKELFQFQAFTMVFAGVSTLILQADLQVLKIFGPSGDEGKYLLGLYRAAQQFAQIPFQAVFAITFVLFPLVSAAAGRDSEKMRGYVRETTRYAFIIAAIICAMFFACPERTLTILFKPEYMAAGETLRILVLGYMLFSPLYIMCAILNAGGRPTFSVIIVAVTVVIECLLAYYLVADYGIAGIATATSIAMAVGFGLGHLFLRRSFGQGVVFPVYIKTIIAAAVIAAAGHALLARETLWGGHGLVAMVGGTGLTAKLMTVVGFSVLGLIYLILLSIIGVLNTEDKAKFMKVIKRG
ncbi:MAG: oligosaccharide flippase family protein [Planctomycetota bacterium]